MKRLLNHFKRCAQQDSENTPSTRGAPRRPIVSARLGAGDAGRSGSLNQNLTWVHLPEAVLEFERGLPAVKQTSNIIAYIEAQLQAAQQIGEVIYMDTDSFVLNCGGQLVRVHLFDIEVNPKPTKHPEDTVS